MAERFPGCTAWGLRWLLLLCTLVTGDLEVETAEGTQMVFLHDNVTVPCRVPGSPPVDIRTVGIIWFWKSELAESEVTVFEFYGDHLEAFRPGAMVSPQSLERGDASLQLPGIQLWETGEYRCKLVVTPEKAEGKTRLEVVARPTITLTEEDTIVRNHKEKNIICKVDGFYPEVISIKWEKCTLKDPEFREITEDIVTGPTVKNEDGTFSVTSRLKLKSSLEDSGAICRCEVGHKSLHISKSFGVMVPVEGTRHLIDIPVAVIIVLVCTTLIVCCIFVNREEQGSSDIHVKIII